jgi:hypothetical protein
VPLKKPVRDLSNMFSIEKVYDPYIGLYFSSELSGTETKTTGTFSAKNFSLRSQYFISRKKSLGDFPDFFSLVP